MQSGEMENKQFQRHRDARELQIEGRMKERMVGKLRKKADIKGHTVWEVAVRLAYLPLRVSLAAA